MKRCFIAALVVLLFVALIHTWMAYKNFVFSESAVAAIAKQHIIPKDKPVTASVITLAFQSIHADLEAKYPGHILPKSELQWLFMNAGGWMGSMCLLHASLTEYVLFFGSAIDTAGHSGRYWANISDTVLSGEFEQWEEGKLTSRIHKPGTTVTHVWGSVTAVHFKSGTWMVEYGRGFIPSTLGFALADTLFSTQDFITLFHICRVYVKALIQETAYYLVNFNELFA